MTTPEDAYQTLARIFSSRKDKVLEIEIIPSALGSSFLEDSLSIGITKKALVQAYVIARHLFAQHFLPMSEDKFMIYLESENRVEEQSDLVITEVMLLFDCEHLTACNWRKRRLQAALRHSLNTGERLSSTLQMLETELTLMTTYQCSPLHRHTKSPTLWSHRLWVLRQLVLLRHSNAEALLELVRAELNCVLRAAELHPKNYYAFNYMRQLCAVLAKSATDIKDGSFWTVELARALIYPLLDWCLRNPRDISGWIFGKYLLSHIPDRQVRADIVSRVLRFARDVGWEGESVWTFIDQSLREFDLESVAEGIITLNEEVQIPPGLNQRTPQSWAWQARLARAKAHWAVHEEGNDLWWLTPNTRL